MTDKGVTVASHAPMAMTISALDEGKNGMMKSHGIHGNRHHGAVSGMGITRGVEPGLVDRWLKEHPEHGPTDTDPLGMLHVVSDDDLKKHQEATEQYGFQPGIDQIDTAGQAEGSLETGHASTVDMAAVSYEPVQEPSGADPVLAQQERVHDHSATFGNLNHEKV